MALCVLRHDIQIIQGQHRQYEKRPSLLFIWQSCQDMTQPDASRLSIILFWSAIQRRWGAVVVCLLIFVDDVIACWSSCSSMASSSSSSSRNLLHIVHIVIKCDCFPAAMTMYLLALFFMNSRKIDSGKWEEEDDADISMTMTMPSPLSWIFWVPAMVPMLPDLLVFFFFFVLCLPFLLSNVRW